MKCTYRFEELIKYTDGGMCDQEKNELTSHLKRCEVCSKRLRLLNLTEGYINEEVKTSGNIHLKVMSSIDNNRYSKNKARYALGASLFKLKPVLKPIAAVFLICILTMVTIYHSGYVSNIFTALSDFIPEMKGKEKDDPIDKSRVSQFFTDEPVSELNKGHVPKGWVLSEEKVLKGVGGLTQAVVKLYVKPSANSASSKTETGEVLAFLEDGEGFYELGSVTNYGTLDVEVKAWDLNNDGVRDISIKGGMGASSVQFKVIGRDDKSHQWKQWLNTDYCEVMDLDNDAKVELVTTSVGSLPSFVWIYRWDTDHYEKLDVAEATGNEYAVVLKGDTGNVHFESGKSGEKHIYIYQNGILEEVRDTKPALHKERLTPMHFYTYVRKDIWGKQGPGESYENKIHIPKERVIKVIGGHTENGGSDGWYLAKLAPKLNDKGISIELAENQTEFWVNFESVGPRYDHIVTFEQCTASDASLFHFIITGKDNEEGEVHIKQLPDIKSPTVSIAQRGNLISVEQKNEHWSFIRIIGGRSLEEYSDAGWIKNSDYVQYQKGVYQNQGFILTPIDIYEESDENSTCHPLDNAIKSGIAPVTVYKEKSRSGWDFICGSFNGIQGWVKSDRIKYSFTAEEINKIANPDIDLEGLTEKFREEIKTWSDLNLYALDIGSHTKLTQNQRKELADRLAIEGFEVYDGGLEPYREAVYPFYTLQFLSGINDYWVSGNDDMNAIYKLYKPAYCKYSFIVTGDDSLMIQIPDDKLDYFEMRREGPPIKFLKVNKSFISYIKNLLPSGLGTDLNKNEGLNSLMSAMKVDAGSIAGSEPQQVYKCIRLIRSYAGEEIDSSNVEKNGKEMMSFKFTFKDGSTKKVLVTDKYIEYNGRYYSLTGNPDTIGMALFTGYF